MLFAAALVFTGCSNGSDSGGTPPVPKYKVELNRTVGGNVKVTPALSDDGMAAENTVLTFKAEPLQGYDLEKWELDGTEVNGTALTYTLKVTANAQVKVFFKMNGGPVSMRTVTITPPQHGRITSVPEIPSDNQVPKGTELIFTAVPDAGYGVDTWSVIPEGDLTAGGTPGSSTARLSVGNDVFVTVTFKQVWFKIDFGVDGGHGTLKAKVGGIEIYSGDKVRKDKTVTFTATPDPGYAVEKWMNGGTDITGAGTNSVYNRVVTANAHIKVKFKSTYTGPALTVDTTAFTKEKGQSFTYTLVTAGSGSYTAMPENPSVISVNLNNATGKVTVQCTGEGSSRIKVKDNMSGLEAYSGTVTVQDLAGIPDDFIADGIHYRVVDKPNKYVYIDYKVGGFGADVHIPATVTFNGKTYAITGCTVNCLKNNFKWTAAFTVDSANAFLCAENGVLFNKDKTRLIKYPKKKTDASYTVPDSVKTIGRYAFYMIENNLTTLNLPEGKALTTVEDQGISYCTLLADVNIPSTLRNLGEEFLYWTGITGAVVIPEGIESLKVYSFAWCPNLTRAELPASFKSSADIFFNCPALTEVTCKAVTPPSVHGFDAGTPAASCTLKVPSGSVGDYETAPIWKDFKKPFVGL